MSPTPADARWPDDRATDVHVLPAQKAFAPGGGAYPARLVGTEQHTALVERVPDGTPATLVVARPEALAATLQRDDLTHVDGAPLVLVSPGYGVLGVATGPPECPERLSVVSVVAIEGGRAVEIPAPEPGQPGWRLFVARVLDPSAGTRGGPEG